MAVRDDAIFALLEGDFIRKARHPLRLGTTV